MPAPRPEDEEEWQKLQAAAYELNQETFSVILGTKELYYPKFTDMNSYCSVFPLAQ